MESAAGTTVSAAAPSPATPTLVIQATRGWGTLGLRELWDYRDLLYFHVWRNVKGKYRQMALGPTWIVLQPVFTMVVLSFVFGRVARLPSEGVPYPIFSYTALLPWTFFANTCTGSSNSLVSQMGVISKVYFPRMIMPLSAMIAGLIDFVICFVILLILMAVYGYWPRPEMLLMPVFVLLAAACGLAVGLWTSSLTVRFRDLQVLIASAVRLAMYLTPVAYSATVVAERLPQWMWLYKLNPLYWVIEGFRWCALGVGDAPELYTLVPVGITVLMLISGAYVFRRTERTIVDLL